MNLIKNKLTTNSLYNIKLGVNYLTKYNIGSKTWLNRHINDDFVKKSQLLNYRSRAAFKLLEIQTKFKLLKPNQCVLDFGAAPGGWSQIIAPIIKSTENSPTVIAVDLLNFEPIPAVRIIKGDINSKKVQNEIFKLNKFSKFDVICSDACPEFIGVKDTDIIRSNELNLMIFKYSIKYLKKEGHLVLKSFESKQSNDLISNLKPNFKLVNKFKPSSSRSVSSESYIVCLNFNPSTEHLSKINLNIKEEKELINNGTKDNKLKYFEEINNKFEKLVSNKVDKSEEVLEEEKIKKLREDKLHKMDIIKLKLDEIEYKNIQLTELERLMYEENKLCSLREDDFKENKTLKKFINWRNREEENEINKYKNMHESSIYDDDDLEKQMNRKHEFEEKKREKLIENKRLKK